MTSKLSLFHRYIALSVLASSIGLFDIPVSRAQDPADAPPPPQADDQQPQPTQRRVISRDRLGQDPNAQAQGQNPNDSPQRPPSPNRQLYAQPPAYAAAPDSITVPAGKVLFIRLNEPLSSDQNHVGDTFTATLDQPLVINGWVVARRGQTIVGNVSAAQKAGRVKGVSQLGLELTEVTVVDGEQVPVSGELWNGSAGTSHGADAAGIATTTGVGTIIGAAVNGGEGAGIGAGIGAAAGIAAVLLTRGKPTVLGPETQLSFRLKAPLTVSTVNSKQAFLPVRPGDYNSATSRRYRSAPGYPPPYYANCGPYWGCSPYYYPYYGPAIGIGFYGGSWGGYRHGFHR